MGLYSLFVEDKMEKTRAYGREDLGMKDLLDSIKKKEDRKLLTKWANERIANGLNLKGTVSRLYTLKRISDYMKCDMKDATKEDITKLLSLKIEKEKINFSKLYYKKLIRLFYKWVKGTDDYPDLVKWIRMKRTIDETPEEHKSMSDEEMREIIDAMVTQRDRTVFSIMAENPTRPKDICNLKFNDVVVDEYGYELKIGSKTPRGRRTIRLINSVPEFRLYLNAYPYRDNPEAPLFYQISSNRFGQPMGWKAMDRALKMALKRTNIKRKINLYDFRRTSTTNLLQDPRYTPEEVKVMGGWSSIRMFDTYGKVTSQMVNKKKLQANGLIEDDGTKKTDPLKPLKCPRCNTVNTRATLTCVKCWLPLKKNIAEMKEKVIRKAINKGEVLSKIMVKEALKELIKEGEIKI